MPHRTTSIDDTFVSLQLPLAIVVLRFPPFEAPVSSQKLSPQKGWVFVFLFLSLSAHADVRLGIVTDVPLMVGGRIEIRPQELSPVAFNIQAGLIPGFYVNGLYGIGVLEGSQTLWQETIGDAKVITVAVEVDLWKGLNVDLGYMLFTGGGETSLGTILAEALGIQSAIFQNTLIPLYGTFHGVFLRGGYRFSLGDGFFLNLQAGVTKPLASSVTFSSTGTPTALDPLLQAYTDDAIGRMWIPTVGLALVFQLDGASEDGEDLDNRDKNPAAKKSPKTAPPNPRSDVPEYDDLEEAPPSY